ncbi:MAG: hypothetical protein HQK49_14115 [Oligoflexia bacterium]|nr:hypothetical protein [Oligoflexia bacterium]
MLLKYLITFVSLLMVNIISIPVSLSSQEVKLYSQINEMIIERGNFGENRSLVDYSSMLPGLLDEIKTLKKGDHIIDAGAGNLIAVMDILNDENLQGLNISAISAGIDFDKIRLSKELAEKRTGKYNLFEKMFNKIKDEEITKDLGKAKLIMDVFGILSYSISPAKDLKRYLDLLKDDGLIYLVSSSLDHLPSSKVVLKDEKKSKISILKLLMQIPGIKVTPLDFSYDLSNQEHIEAVKITIVDRDKIVIPNIIINDLVTTFSGTGCRTFIEY